jgi:eukaryotic-like serine/threonine-protein kinase
MKTCTDCHRLFQDDDGFCPIDGQRLVPMAECAVPSDPKDARMGGTFCEGRYQIWRKVADGGMGRVYQALDKHTNECVALKILHSDVATDPVSLERFKREFEVSAALPHDHIVDVLAFEKTEDGSYALVMEYLEGEELRMLLKRDKIMPPERVVRMLSQVAIGLTAAHDRKVVHRDLKPDNVFLCGTRDGDVVKILDFGSVRDNSEGAKKLTVMGTTIGSPFYMAPEQAQGLETLDHRADVWSAAAIAYECLTGKVPFHAATGPAILLTILTKEALPPSVVSNGATPRALDGVMEEALTKNPAIRIPTIGALADRIGAAYGFEGDHQLWARMPQADLAARGAPITGAHAPASAPIEKAVDSFQLRVMDDAFRAGSEGGPTGAFGADDSFVMGVPADRPKWVLAAIAGGAVLVGVLITLLIAR